MPWKVDGSLGFVFEEWLLFPKVDVGKFSANCGEKWNGFCVFGKLGLVGRYTNVLMLRFDHFRENLFDGRRKLSFFF